MMKRIATIILVLMSIGSYAQLDNINTVIIDYDDPQKYQIGNISVSGSNYTDEKIIILMSGLSVGQTITIPGDETGLAIERLWKNNLFSDIEIGIEKAEGTSLYLNIVVTERPRLSKYSIKGLRKGETNNVRDEITNYVTKHLKQTQGYMPIPQ